jgi:UDP-glucose 4-epimerase
VTIRHLHCCSQMVFSSTCATYGNPAQLPVTEETPTLPINPYGRAKLMAEQVIRDYAHADTALNVVIFRYFNVYGSDLQGFLGEYPPPTLRQHARISNACMDAALKQRASLTISGADLQDAAACCTSAEWICA